MYALLGFLIAPMGVKWYLPYYCKEHLKFTAHIGTVRLNPFLLTFEARDFRIQNTGGEPLAGFEKLFVEFKPFGLFNRTTRFGSVILEKPAVNLVIERDGSFNFPGLAPPSGDAAPPEKAQNPPSDPLRVLLDSLNLSGGEFAITDNRGSSPATLAIRDISLNLKDISTIRDRTGNCALSATTGDGETLEWQGELGLTPFASSGRISFSGIRAATAWGFVRDSFNLDTPSGTLDLSTDYRIDSSGPSLQLVLESIKAAVSGVSIKLHGEQKGFFELSSLAVESTSFDLESKSIRTGKISATGAKLRLQGGEDGRMNLQRILRSSGHKTKASAAGQGEGGAPKPGPGGWKLNIDSLEIKDFSSEAEFAQKGNSVPAFDVKLLAVDGAGIDLGKQAAAVSRIRLDGGRLDAGLDPDGSLNIGRIFAGKSKAPEAQGSVPAQQTGTWKFLVKEFELKNFQSAFSDYGASEQPLYNIKDLNAHIDTIDGKSPMGVDVSFGVEQGGSFTVQGKVDPSAQSVDAKLKMDHLVLTPLRPYLSRFINLTLESAALSAEGAMRYGIPGSESKIAYEGGFSLDNLNLAQLDSKEPYLGFDAMQATKLKLTLDPNNLEVESIKLTKPFGELIIAEDKTVNFSKLLKEQPAAKTAPPQDSARKVPRVASAPDDKQKSRSDSFSYNIGTIQIDQGKVLFADLSLQPKFMTRIHDLKGTIARLSSERGVVSRIALDGGVDRYGTAKVHGSLDPGDYKRSTDISMVFRNVDMSSVNPYSGKFAGRKIVSGKLSMDLNYQIQGNKLVGDNKIIVDNLVLGEHVNSPDAVNLPLDLAVALLSDSNGRIDIGLPVTGDLNDPQFSLAPLISKAFIALITKIVTAPFRALGALLGGKSQDTIDSVLFDPGKAELQPPEKEKLKTLSEALSKKPLLRLAVQGRYSPEADSIVLKHMAVSRETAKRIGIKESNIQDTGLDFSDSKVRGALESMYVERFGKKALDEVDQAVKKGEIKPRESSIQDSGRKKSKKAGIASKLFSSAKIYKVVPGMMSPEQSQVVASELFARLVEGEQIPEKDLLELANSRGRSITAEFEQLGMIGKDRLESKDPGPAPGEEGLSAKLMLDTIQRR